MKSYRFAILKNENPDEHREWVVACENMPNVSFDIIEFTGSDWLKAVKEKSFDCFLARPSGTVSFWKNLYDERLIILSKMPGTRIYPSLDELLIYENKRMLAYFLGIHDIPHPKTWIFYDKNEALAFAENCVYPLVGKTSIGAGGSGVKMLNSRKALMNYINLAFSNKGITRNWGINLRKGNFVNRLGQRMSDPIAALRYFSRKKRNATIDPQKWHVILQQFLHVDFEWRCVKIGNSYFGHKKLRRYGEKISGTSNVNWDVPPLKLLEFMKNVTEQGNLQSQAMDIFEDAEGNYFVNELQCFWGSKNPHQMIRNGIPGRFRWENKSYIFEEGSFSQNNSYDLRLQHVIELLEQDRL